MYDEAQISVRENARKVHPGEVDDKESGNRSEGRTAGMSVLAVLATEHDHGEDADGPNLNDQIHTGRL